MKKQLPIFIASPENIWNYKQNHPELVTEDIKQYVPTLLKTYNLHLLHKISFIEDLQDLVRQSMLCRGINKWLKVRRDLIAYKKQLKHKIKELNVNVPKLKSEMSVLYCHPSQVEKGEKTIYDFQNYFHKRLEYEKNKEVLKHLTEIRGNLKALCMTDRWQIWTNKKLEDMNTIKASD
jgi:hypothetical protein